MCAIKIVVIPNLNFNVANIIRSETPIIISGTTRGKTLRFFKYFLPLKSNHFKAIAPKVPITVETKDEIRAIKIL